MIIRLMAPGGGLGGVWVRGGWGREVVWSMHLPDYCNRGYLIIKEKFKLQLMIKPRAVMYNMYTTVHYKALQYCTV